MSIRAEKTTIDNPKAASARTLDDVLQIGKVHAVTLTGGRSVPASISTETATERDNDTFSELISKPMNVYVLWILLQSLRKQELDGYWLAFTKPPHERRLGLDHYQINLYRNLYAIYLIIRPYATIQRGEIMTLTQKADYMKTMTAYAHQFIAGIRKTYPYDEYDIAFVVIIYQHFCVVIDNEMAKMYKTTSVHVSRAEFVARYFDILNEFLKGTGKYKELGLRTFLDSWYAEYQNNNFDVYRPGRRV